MHCKLLHAERPLIQPQPNMDKNSMPFDFFLSFNFNVGVPIILDDLVKMAFTYNLDCF